MVWRLIRSKPEGTMDIILDGIIRNFIKGRRRNTTAAEMAGEIVDLSTESSAGRPGVLQDRP